MRLAVVVVGDGRSQYLDQAVSAAYAHIDYTPVTRMMVDDTGDRDYSRYLDDRFPEFQIVHHTARLGMAGAVRAGFAAAADSGCDYACWVEEDMVLTRDLPVVEAADALRTHEQLAQMTFKREPWWGIEVDLDDQLKAIRALAPHSGELGGFTYHDHIFSLNPCLIPRRVLEQGWPDGNEAEQTARMLAEGYLFAMWGGTDDLPFARHIGAERSPAWAL